MTASPIFTVHLFLNESVFINITIFLLLAIVNILTVFLLWGNIPTFLDNWTVATQQTFQHCFIVGFRLIWCRDVTKRQTNVEKKLCASTLMFTTSNNVESMLSISTLTLTTLEKVGTMLSFSTCIFITLGNVETTMWIWPFERNKK